MKIARAARGCLSLWPPRVPRERGCVRASETNARKGAGDVRARARIASNATSLNSVAVLRADLRSDLRTDYARAAVTATALFCDAGGFAPRVKCRAKTMTRGSRRIEAWSLTAAQDSPRFSAGSKKGVRLFPAICLTTNWVI